MALKFMDHLETMKTLKAGICDLDHRGPFLGGVGIHPKGHGE